MPEGPEIRRAADRVGKVLVGRTVTEVSFGLERLRSWEEPLTGRSIEAVDTAGKAMLTRFDDGHVLYSHNQLYGRWYVRRRGNLPKTNRQLRVALHTQTHSALLYSASEIEVLERDELARHPFLSRLGPDPLWRETSPETMLERLEDDDVTGRQLGGLLLDQGFVAGLGNYLRSEILWFARIHPRRRPADLDRRERRRLARQLLDLPRRSYRTGGVTNPPSLVEELERRGASGRRTRFAVFGRAGRACLECETEIDRTEIASRRLYLCPSCQEPPSDRD